MSQKILNHPVAKRDDPITSYEAGESTKARTISHSTVLSLLLSHGEATQEHVVQDAHQLDIPASESRIRSAFPELERLGLTERTGEVEKTGRNPKQLWRLTAAGRKEAQK